MMIIENVNKKYQSNENEPITTILYTILGKEHTK